MQLKYFLSATALHMVAPLPSNLIKAIVISVIWLALRQVFIWVRTTPRPIGRVRDVVRMHVGRAWKPAVSTAGLAHR